MTRINKLPLMALAFGAMMTAATVAWAEGETTDMNTTTTDTLPLDATMLTEIEDESVMYDGLTVGEIEGTDVYVGENDIGEIEKVLADDTGQVQAYILGVEDGVFDLDATKFVVPADEFTFDAENERFSTQLTQADFETYPTWQ